jgi:3-oxoacyl-[acyl-carrier-protein] synthase III
MEASELDCIIYATLSPDYFFPGGGVYLQRKLGVTGIPAMDIRNQCTGFIYGLSVADAWIRTGQYRRVLLVGSEVHSTGLDYSPAGRDVGVLFGDGAGAAILGPTEDEGTRRPVHPPLLRRPGRREALGRIGGGRPQPHASPTRTWTQGKHFPVMEGPGGLQERRGPDARVGRGALEHNGLGVEDVDLLIAHQANLRINEMVAKKAGAPDDQVYNNIQRYGNTTAATIPIAMHEAVEKGLLDRGDLLVLTAFGSGFTWASAAIRW